MVSRRTRISSQIKGNAQGSTAALRQQVLARNRRRVRGVPKISTVSLYVGIFAIIVAVIAVGYQAPEQSSGISNANIISAETQTTSVDEVVAANIAAGAALVTDSAVKTEVLNKAVTTQLIQENAVLSASSSVKPQILQPTSGSRTITNYTVKSGDTVGSIAAGFGISKETVKWVNDLSSDSIDVGQKLKILPVDGIIYTVQSGDTIASIASKYKVNESRLVLYNDLDLGGLSVGKELILPNATLPNNERPGYEAPVTYIQNNYGYQSDNIVPVNPGKYVGVSVYTSRYDAGNKNTAGQCTWYAWERRKAIGRPLPSSALGDAGQWAYSLSNYYGYSVNTVPAVGALIQNGGYPGHVGVVERINADGSLLISDMNYGYRTFVVTERTIPASATGYFNYIH